MVNVLLPCKLSPSILTSNVAYSKGIGLLSSISKLTGLRTYVVISTSFSAIGESVSKTTVYHIYSPLSS